MSGIWEAVSKPNERQKKPRTKIDELYDVSIKRLERYPDFLVMLNTEIVNRERAMARIGEVSRAISRYSERTPSDTNTPLTEPEGYVAAQERAKKTIERCDKTIAHIRSIIQPLDEALATLTPEEVKVLSLRFWGLESPSYLMLFDRDGICGKGWGEFEARGYSRTTAIRIFKRATWKVRGMVFPGWRDEGTGIISVE